MSHQQQNIFNQHSVQPVQSEDTFTVQSGDPNTNSSCDSKTGQSQEYSYSSKALNKAKTNSKKSNFTKKNHLWTKQQMNFRHNVNPFRAIQKKTDRFRVISNTFQEQSSDEKILSNSMDNIGSKNTQSFCLMDQKVNNNYSIQSNYQQKIIRIHEDIEFDQKSSCKTTVSKLVQSTPLEEKNLQYQPKRKEKQLLFESFQSLQSDHHIDQAIQQKDQVSEINSNDNEMFYSQEQNEPATNIEIDHCNYLQFQTEKIINYETLQLDVKHLEDIKKLREALRESIDQNQLLKDRIVILQSIIGQLTSGANCEIKKKEDNTKKLTLSDRERCSRKYSC